jgi:hypothetical protein
MADRSDDNRDAGHGEAVSLTVSADEARAIDSWSEPTWPHGARLPDAGSRVSLFSPPRTSSVICAPQQKRPAPGGPTVTGGAFNVRHTLLRLRIGRVSHH